MIGAGPILYGSRPGAPAGFVNVAGANDGLSIDATHFIQLGQLAGTGSAGPAKLLDSREIPLLANNLQLGLPGDSGFLVLNPFLTLIQDITGAGAGFIFPVTNTTTTGIPGIQTGLFTGESTIAFSDPAASGQVSDFRSFTNWNPSAGSTAFVSFHANADTVQTGGSGDMISFFSNQTIQPTGGTGVIRGLYHFPTLTTLAAMTHIAIENVTGDNRFNSAVTAAGPGRSGFRQQGAAPNAYVHIGASTGAAGNGPLKLTAGTLLGTPETGLFEFDGTHLYFTIGATRTTLI